MRYRLRVVLFVVIIFALGVIFSGCGTHTSPKAETLLRLHIRANSNSALDQSVKLVVRDAVVEYLEKELGNVTDLETAKKEIENRLSKLKAIADGILAENGFSYKSAAKLSNEFFPTRSYEDLVLESGYYDAVVIGLGDAAGDNWWCVVYPPLCYLEAKESNGLPYKSKIAELIKKFFKD